MATMLAQSAEQPMGELPTQRLGDPGEESLIILQSLLCVLRERNLLSRADLELLCEKVERRARGESRLPLPYCPQSAREASGLMRRLTSYIGQRYGGKHGRH